MNYDNRPRTFKYLFTVKNCPTGDALFKALCRLETRPPFTRYGRLSDRASKGVSNERGQVPLEVADRWDLYLSAADMEVVRYFLRRPSVENIIQSYLNVILYANVLYKRNFEDIESTQSKPFSIESIKKEFYKNSEVSNWPFCDEIITNLENRWIFDQLEDFYNSSAAQKHLPCEDELLDRNTKIPRGPLPNAVHDKASQVIDDYVKGLPLVTFWYGNKERMIRVVRYNQQYLGGYDVNCQLQYKLFCRDKISSDVVFISYTPPLAKQD